MSLARLWKRQGLQRGSSPRPGRRLRTLPEGFATPDLLEAAARSFKAKPRTVPGNENTAER